MRVVVRTVSELCVTVGALIVLFVAYVLFWTGVKADTVMDDQIDQLQNQWSQGSVRQPKVTAGASAAPALPAPYRSGKPFAIMYIPGSVSRGTSPCSKAPRSAP